MAEKHDTVRGLVLAGGGAKGSYQVGVYQALMELGWLPDVITGASVGSLNAALFVMGKVNEAADLWRSLDNHGVLELPEGKTPEELRDFLLETLRGGGLNTEPLGQTIDQYMAGRERHPGIPHQVRFGDYRNEHPAQRAVYTG